MGRYGQFDEEFVVVNENNGHLITIGKYGQTCRQQKTWATRKNGKYM